MIKQLIIAGSLMATAMLANAKDNVHYFDFNQAVQSAVNDGTLDGSVKFYLAGTQSGGQVIQKGLVSNKKTNGFNKSPEQACEWALRSALIQFEHAAKARGANAVTNIVSYYKKNEYKDSTNYECHDGRFATGITIKGDVVKF